MTVMRSRLLTLAFAASLLLCLATMALWVITNFREVRLLESHIVVEHDHPQRVLWEVDVIAGRLTLDRLTYDASDQNFMPWPDGLSLEVNSDVEIELLGHLMSWWTCSRVKNGFIIAFPLP